MPAGTVNVPLDVNTCTLEKPVCMVVDAHVVPLDASTLPDVPGATN
jgi:hypothetical protein